MVGSDTVRGYLLGAGLNGALGVAMGAWAAHGLQATLPAPAIEWIKTGASYQRQRVVAAQHHGELDAVVASLVAEMRAGHPLPAW